MHYIDYTCDLKFVQAGEEASHMLNRRSFLGRGLNAATVSLALSHVASAGRATAAGVKSFDLDEVTIAELQERLESGEFTARVLAEKYLERIAEIDKRGPAVNAVIELNPDALAIADALDKERRQKGRRGPLHGIPVLLKDNMSTADRMTTTAGSLALAGFIPGKDAGIVRRLRNRGAVILGKANLSEWANFRSSYSSSGWSGRGGQTRNPYCLDRNPNGSSSGSAAAVAANMCAVAVGTETDGSIVGPASANGVVGIKPTIGLISGAGIIPISHNQDTAGPLCRTVADAAMVLGEIAKSLRDYASFLTRDGLRGARIGVVRNSFELSAGSGNAQGDELIRSLFDEAVHVVKAEGAILVDPIEMKSLGMLGESEFEVLLYDFKADLDAYLADFGANAPVHSLADIIEFNERNRAKEMAHFGQDIFLKAQEKGQRTEKAYRDALIRSRRLAREEGIDAVMDRYRLDALIGITTGPAWLTDLVDGDHDPGGVFPLAAVAGYPNVNVPMGSILGLPVGVSFFGRAWSEGPLIRMAHSFEQATKARKAPAFATSVISRA
jgi:amidase